MDIRAHPSGDDLRALTTQTLVDRAAQGDGEAVRAVYERLRPRLLQWSRGRLPAYARDLNQTDDLVQDVLLRSLSSLDGFQQQGGGFLAYLCTSVMNRVRNEIRRAKGLPERGCGEEAVPSRDASPIEQAIGKETEERYRRALATLSPEQQDLVVGRLELEMSFQELALHAGKPSADAARMGVNRAIARLAEVLAEDDPEA